MRTFTVDEANALIPMLAPVLEDLRTWAGKMREVGEEVAEFEHLAAQNGHGEHSPIFAPDRDLDRIRQEMRARLLYLQELGVRLTDIDSGILDFPSRMGGRDVFLCWQLGEEQVSHWHDLDAGYAGRRPL